MTFFIMTLSLLGLTMTYSMNDTQHNNRVVMLNVVYAVSVFIVILNVVILSVIILNVLAPVETWLFYKIA
jgi:hypothetical protein